MNLTFYDQLSSTLLLLFLSMNDRNLALPLPHPHPHPHLFPMYDSIDRTYIPISHQLNEICDDLIFDVEQR
jgi:hypothetical protein